MARRPETLAGVLIHTQASSLSPTRRRHDDSEPGNPTVDAPVLPWLVLSRQPEHHRPHSAAHWRTAGTSPAGQPRPPAADNVAVPAQNRCRVTISRNPARRADWQHPGEQRQPRPVRPRQPRMSPRPLAQGHRELMAHHQDLGVLPPRLPPRQAQHRPGPVTTRKISFKPRSRRSSHASPTKPARPAPVRVTEPSAARRASAQVVPVFRHPQLLRDGSWSWCRVIGQRRGRWCVGIRWYASPPLAAARLVPVRPEWDPAPSAINASPALHPGCTAACPIAIKLG
jgi:hypothetical protein